MSAFPVAALQRAKGRAEACVRADEAGRTRLHRLHQSGCLKLRFPRLPPDAAGVEGVLINTAGGLTGGDQIAQSYRVEAGAALTVTTQAAERIYRSTGGDALAETRASVGENGCLRFLPQETILFDGGRLRRSLDVDLVPGARLLLCESVILGRIAMGERVREGLLHDSWRVRSDGRLLFAEEMRLSGAIAALAAKRATLADNLAYATILCRDPAAEARLGEVRRLAGALGGASLAEDGLLVARLLAPTGFALRKRLIPVLQALANEPLPRVWSL